MTVALELPDDPRHDLLTRLVAALVMAKKTQRRVEKADRRLAREIEAAALRFATDIAAAIERRARARPV